MMPATVTQRTCEQALGVSRRWFLDYLAQHPELPRAVLGRQVIVRTSDWLAHLAEHVTTGAAPNDGECWTPEALLARRGLRSVGGAR